MKKETPATHRNGKVVPRHEIERVCENCGFGVDESEAQAATCSDCGEPLRVRQSTTIYSTSTPDSDKVLGRSGPRKVNGSRGPKNR